MSFNLEVRTIAGDLVSKVDVGPLQAVRDILQSATAASSTEEDKGDGSRRSLVHGGQVLALDSSIQSYGLCAGDVLYLIREPRAPTRINLFANHSLRTAGLSDLVAELSCQDSFPMSALDVGYCGLRGAEGASAIAVFARASRSLEQLKCSGNGLGAVGVAELAERLQGSHVSLETVSIRDCGLCGESGGVAVAKLFHAVSGKDLCISGNPELGVAGLLAFIRESPDLAGPRSLDAGFCGLTGADGGSSLANLLSGGLEKLTLSCNQCLEGLSTATFANSLPPGLCSTKLKVLVLDGCGIQGRKGGLIVSQLWKRAINLQELSLSDNERFGVEGVRALCEGMSEDSLLTSLCLSRTGLQGAESGTAVSQFLRKAPDLQELDVQNNAELGCNGVHALVSGLPPGNRLRELDFATCSIEDLPGSGILSDLVKACPDLEVLSIGMNGMLTAEGIAMLEQAFSSCKENGGCRLRALHLEGCSLRGAAGGRALASLVSCLPRLEQLGLLCNPDLGAEGVLALAEGISDRIPLRCVGVEACGLAGAAGGIASGALVRALPALEELGLSSNTALGAEGLVAFATSLQPTMPHMKQLDLVDCGLEGAAGGHIVAKVVAAAPSLQRLSVARCNNLGAQGVCALLDSLPPGSLLSSLDVGHCGIGQGGVDDGARVGASLSKFLAC
mmetsp:Transcript_112814/g.224418  ORF Transcript_112814/g.224418 Transcript_112814/m.224418 type:complete len:675 (-) Transcript_112814:100-2124(-)